MENRTTNHTSTNDSDIVQRFCHDMYHETLRVKHNTSRSSSPDPMVPQLARRLLSVCLFCFFLCPFLRLFALFALLVGFLFSFFFSFFFQSYRIFRGFPCDNLKVFVSGFSLGNKTQCIAEFFTKGCSAFMETN